eukprot:6052861-Amphidinium_carterae.1
MNLAEIEGELTKTEKVALATLDEAGVECVEEEDVDVEEAEEGVQDVYGDVVEVQDTGKGTTSQETQESHCAQSSPA